MVNIDNTQLIKTTDRGMPSIDKIKTNTPQRIAYSEVALTICHKDSNAIYLRIEW